MTDLLARQTAVRVLVIEDNPGDAELAAIALGDASQEYDVTCATSIAGALDLLASADVVLLDLDLPDASRLEGLARLRGARPDAAVIILTGEADVPLAEAALASGAQDYLLKGEIDGRSLERAIRYARSRQALLRRIEGSERWAQALVHSVSDVVSIHRADGEIIHLGGLAGALLPWSAQPCIGDVRNHVDNATWRAMVQAFRRWRGSDQSPAEFAVRTGAGEVRHFESMATNMLDDPVIAGVVVVSRDVTDRHAIQDRLSQEATHDSLTGLPNRVLFHAQLRMALARQLREQNTVAVLMVDLDDFKKVNDSYGHAAGDEVLTAVAMLLSIAVRDGDTLARIGGDEFVIVCPDVTPEAAQQIGHRLQRALVRPFGANGREVHLGASVGVAVAPPGFDGGPDELFRNADIALYEAKRTGGGTVSPFTPELEQKVLRRMDLETELRGAITRGELAVVYQPIVSLQDGRVQGHEALLRWTHPRLGEVPPAEFIAVAETAGLIIPIGRWVAEQACMQLASWQRAGVGLDAAIAVNVSARQLADPHFVDELTDVLLRNRIPPHGLCLEVTETALIAEVGDSSMTLGRLRALGVRVALDDFGTGYSSLTYLKRLPVDVLKIDRSFIEGIAESDEDRALVASVVRMARALDVEVVAEGVEHPAQRDVLRSLGCDRAQGFLWSAALEPDAAGEALSRTFQLGGSVRRHDDHDPGTSRRDVGTTSTDDALTLVSHELMQPITIIKAFSENFRMLVGSGQITDVAEIADAISRNATHAIDLLRSLADTEALERGVVQLETTPVSLSGAVREVISDLDDLLPVPVDLRAATDVEVQLDRSRFRQIIMNLVANAAKFAPPGSRITVEVATKGDGSHGEVSVVDSGPGVPPDRQSELFTKFGKLGQHRGTGVGLYVSRQLARLHGGDIRYRRADTGGARFTVSIPVASHGAPGALAVRSTGTAPAAGNVAANAPVLRQPTVLDDAVALRALHAATRNLLTADVPERVVSVTIGLVRALGGSVVPADFADPTAMPLDLALGEGPPLLPAAPPLSVARMRLERLLPLFAEDARDALQVARSAARTSGSEIDPTTGLLEQRALQRILREHAGEAAVLAIRVPGAAPASRRRAARLLRSVADECDALGVWDGDVIVAVRREPLARADDLLEQVQDQWLSWGGEPGVQAASAVGADPLETLVARAVARIAAVDEQRPDRTMRPRPGSCSGDPV